MKDEHKLDRRDFQWGGPINRKSARLPKLYGPSPDLPSPAEAGFAKAGGLEPQGGGQLLTMNRCSSVQ